MTRERSRWLFLPRTAHNLARWLTNNVKQQATNKHPSTTVDRRHEDLLSINRTDAMKLLLSAVGFLAAGFPIGSAVEMTPAFKVTWKQDLQGTGTFHLISFFPSANKSDRSRFSCATQITTIRNAKPNTGSPPKQRTTRPTSKPFQLPRLRRQSTSFPNHLNLVPGTCF